MADFLTVGMDYSSELGAYGALVMLPGKARPRRGRVFRTGWPRDQQNYRGSITGFGEGADGPTVELALDCLREGEPVVRASAVFLRPEAT